MIRIIVIGDSCVDVWQYGTISRISPEAPVPVFCPTTKVENGGMMLNVIENLKALDVESELRICAKTNVSKPYKIRYVCEKTNQQLLRVDVNDHIGESFSMSNEIMFEQDCLIVSDYDKGFISEEDMKWLPSMFSISFLDTKKKLGSWADDFTFIKINEEEYNNNVKGYEHDGLIVTLGAKGAKYDGHIYPTEQPSILYDVAGAGDSFLAGLVYEYLRSNDIHLAINYANAVAGLVIQKKGVATI